ncbi:15241_t:CDS:1, partial [Racocetra persica]
LPEIPIGFTCHVDDNEQEVLPSGNCHFVIKHPRKYKIKYYGNNILELEPKIKSYSIKIWLF